MEESPAPTTSYQIQPPDSFDFTKPNDFERWLRRFERFRVASNLAQASDLHQVNTLIYCMGDKADDILCGLAMTTEERGNYETVQNKFKEYFTGKINVIYERAKFNSRKQEQDEPVNDFITALYSLSERCAFGPLRDELIRDRIVVGLKDIKLSERLQLHANLTLEKAITMARQSEAVRKQQAELRQEEDEDLKLDAVHKEMYRQDSTKKPKSGKGGNWKNFQKTRKEKPMKSNCMRCGKSPYHVKDLCPAKEAVCHQCKRTGHYMSQCHSKTVLHEVKEDCDSDEGQAFLGAVDSNTQGWYTTIQILERPVKMKMDTGADVTAIPESIFVLLSSNKNTGLKKTRKVLMGPGKNVLDVKGVFSTTISKNEKNVEEDIYVVKNLFTPLLGRQAIEKLHLITRLDNITECQWQEKYPELFTGLGELKEEYCIKLQPNATPYSVNVARRVPVPLMEKVKEELSRMVKEDIIKKVEGPSDWCSGIVPVLKPDDTVRICVDLTKLNSAVRREKLILPSVDHTLGQLGGAKIFTKLDANSGFWQIRLAEESQRLTTFITPFGRYSFKRLPFGISSAPELFQLKMFPILEGLDGVTCHMDNILMYGRSPEEHDISIEEGTESWPDA